MPLTPQKQFKTWSKMPPSARRSILKRFAEGIRRCADELAQIETYDVGLPFGKIQAATWNGLPLQH
jgi:acyl-CoA reductase-like NAD-dependent aldehyde dehydrogenase